MGIMTSIWINGLTLRDIQVNKTGAYSGVEIHFTVDGLLYNFMVANTSPPLPLNILHRFKEQQRCPICNRMIYPYPFGNQPCTELKKMDKIILEKLYKFV